MSVIFETLQKLNSAPVQAGDGEGGAHPRRNAYALKTVLMSPVSVLILALLVFGLGYGLVYGLRTLQRSARMDPAVLAAAREPVSVAVTVPDTAEASNAMEGSDAASIAEDAVPPPPTLPEQRTADTPIPTPTAGSVAGEGADDAMPVFSGPEVPPPSAAALAALAEAPPASADAWSPTPGGSEATVPGRPPWDATDTAVQTARFNPAPGTRPEGRFQTAAAGPSMDRVAEMAVAVPPDGAFFQPSTPSALTGASAGASSAARVSARAFAPAPAPAADPTGWAAPESSVASTAWPAGATAPLDEGGDDAQRPVKRTVIPRYARLVNQLQTAIVSGDDGTADRLQGQFAAVKGQDHPYLIKLKAYRRLKAGDYAEAERLLNQVLALDRMDRDAQLNLVVVEARTGRLAEARQRVTRLTALYPEDESLAAMGRQLN